MQEPKPIMVDIVEGKGNYRRILPEKYALYLSNVRNKRQCGEFDYFTVLTMKDTREITVAMSIEELFPHLAGIVEHSCYCIDECEGCKCK